jgi:hypothetical protein
MRSPAPLVVAFAGTADEVESPVWRGVIGLGCDLAPVGSDMPWIIER